jgi:hypothetical protein
MSLDRSRDLELRGRGRHSLYRRLGLAALAAIVVVALVGVFGQQSTTTVAAGPGASLEVVAPDRLRGGLLFQARFEIEARAALAHPSLALSSGWLEAMTLNTVVPEPESETSGARGLQMTFPPMPAGRTLTVWTAWQVNPTNVGEHDEDATLLDGPTPLATAHRSLMVFP